MSKTLWALAALASVAVIATGCSGGDDGDAPASTGNEEAVKFAECMRENGVTEFPDPDASGELTIDGIVNGSSIDPGGPTWKGAIDACRDLQPPGFTGGGERTSSEQEAGLEFAECIRENGVADFPDPVNGEPLVNTNRIPSTATDRGMSNLNAAMDACGDILHLGPDQ